MDPDAPEEDDDNDVEDADGDQDETELLWVSVWKEVCYNEKSTPGDSSMLRQH